RGAGRARGWLGEAVNADGAAVRAAQRVVTRRSRAVLVLVRRNRGGDTRRNVQGVDVRLPHTVSPKETAGVSNVGSVRREGGLPLRKTRGAVGEKFGALERVVHVEMNPPEIQVDGRDDTVPVRGVIDVTGEHARGGENRVRT